MTEMKFLEEVLDSLHGTCHVVGRTEVGQESQILRSQRHVHSAPGRERSTTAMCESFGQQERRTAKEEEKRNVRGVHRLVVGADEEEVAGAEGYGDEPQ
jgi:hypothetical protein